jgi:transposase-like protein
MARSLAKWPSAKRPLGDPALGADEPRVATALDVRFIWNHLKVYAMSGAEIRATFGVSRQAVNVWRQKADLGGGPSALDDLPLLSREEYLDKQREETILALFQRAAPTDEAVSLWEIVKLAKVSDMIVRRVAKKHGVTLAVGPRRQRPTDDEIVGLAPGRTWKELALACGVTLGTLRNYVYGKPELSARVRALVQRDAVGWHAHGRVDVAEVVRLYLREGLTPYKIATRLGTNVAGVLYWLKKCDILKPGATTPEA